MLECQATVSFIDDDNTNIYQPVMGAGDDCAVRFTKVTRCASLHLRCSTVVPRGIVGRWATADQSAQVQCCNASGSCIRRDRAGNCFSGDDDGTRATHYEAVAMCSQAGMRLCTMHELQTIDAAGCCGTGCNYDAILVWTSTPITQTPTVAPYVAGAPSNAPTSLTTAPTAAYTTIGSGWCRAAGCDVSGTDCYVAGMRKDYSSAAECMAMCSSMPDCTGYAIASPFYSQSPNRCYVHGAFQTHSGWHDLAMRLSERNRSIAASVMSRSSGMVSDPSPTAQHDQHRPRVARADHLDAIIIGSSALRERDVPGVEASAMVPIRVHPLQAAHENKVLAPSPWHAFQPLEPRSVSPTEISVWHTPPTTDKPVLPPTVSPTPITGGAVTHTASKAFDATRRVALMMHVSLSPAQLRRRLKEFRAWLADALSVEYGAKVRGDAVAVTRVEQCTGTGPVPPAAGGGCTHGADK
eukprot:gene58083-biopygen29658